MKTTNTALKVTVLIPALMLCGFIVTPSALAQGEADTQTPPPAVSVQNATADAALRTFLIALISKDEETIRQVMLPVSVDDLTLLLKGEPLPAEQMDAMKKAMKSVPIRALKAGEVVTLTQGRKFTVPKTAVGANRAVLLPQNAPLPFGLMRIEGGWRVDAAALVAGRRAAERARSKN